MLFKLLIIIAIAILGLIFFFRQQPLPPHPENLSPPKQIALKEKITLAAPQDYTITATDSYSLEAMIFSTKRYHFDEEAKLSPVDFLLAWGPLVNSPNIENIKYSQKNRWGYYRWENDADITVTKKDIIYNHSNTHVIPDFENPHLKDKLLSFRAGDVIKLDGYLVNITKENWFWTTSRSRHDTGNGACEIFYVTHAEKL